MKVFMLVALFLTGTHGGSYNYTEVLHKSILFYEAQRSGKLPAENRVPWRKDSALGDQGDDEEDLTGGWYDAGDYVKFNFPMAFSVTTLAWGILEFKDGYVAAGEYERALDSIKWPLDYLLKCHVSACVLYGQVGDGHKDHAFWGRPEDMKMERPAYKLTSKKAGSDLAAETAAAMAAGYLVFKDEDEKYAKKLLYHAKQIYDFAYNYRGKYSDSITNVQSFYKSWSGYEDELAWGGLWLYWATGDCIYLNRAKEFANKDTHEFSWDSKYSGAHMLMYALTGDKTYKSKVETFIKNWMPKGSVKYTPKGLAWLMKWGALRYTANAALITLVAGRYGINTKDGRAWAESQIGYMLGDTGRSFVVGFGKNPPKRPHHASSSCQKKPAKCDWSTYSSEAPNPHVLYGALVGGPDDKDNYKDVRSDYVMNEVTCDYNAGFQSAIAGLISTSKSTKAKKPGSVDESIPCGKKLSDVESCSSGPSKPTKQPPVTTTDSAVKPGQYNYTEVLHKSILFYEAQRSGKLPSNNRVKWREDSALGDKGDNNEDLTGGWYDAGDYVKFNFPMAFSVTTLAWGILEFKTGYEAAGEYERALDSIKWPLDYLLKCHVSACVLYGQVGDGHKDHAFWGRPEDMKMERPAYKLTAKKAGSDLAAETAAAMAAGYLVFKDEDPKYAEKLLYHAKQIYDFAYTYKAKYSDSITNVQSFYKSWNGYEDELAWGGMWLYWATGDCIYLNTAKKFANVDAYEFSWDGKFTGSHMLLYKLTGDTVYKNKVDNFIKKWMPKGSVQYTPKGLAWYMKWGALRYTANAAMISLVAAKYGIRTEDGRKWAESQIGYMLGDAGRSFVVGFGKNPPQKPHHASSSCPKKPAKCDWSTYNSDAPNPHVLYGALVGGPDDKDNYEDVRSDYVMNEVTCDYNAGFQSAIAGLISAEKDSSTVKHDTVDSKRQCGKVLSDVKNCKATSQKTTTTIMPTSPTRSSTKLTTETTTRETTTPTQTKTSTRSTTGPTSSPVTDDVTTVTTPRTRTRKPKPKGTYNYFTVLKKSILFYEAQRSGKLVNNRIKWRGDSALKDKGDNKEDLTGGYYDGFGFVKNTFTTAFTVTMMSWSVLDFKSAYEKDSKSYSDALAGIRWGTDYLLKCYDGNKTLYAMVGSPVFEWKAWNRPEDMTVDRPVYKVSADKPGTDVVAETAAALAAAAIVFKEKEANYSKVLLQNAVKLFDLASGKNQGIYNKVVPVAYDYWSSDYKDELVWGSLWLYKATSKKGFLTYAESTYKQLSSVNSFTWDKKKAAIDVLLFQITKKKQYKDAIIAFLSKWFPGGQIRYTKKGLAFLRSPDALKYAANAAVIAIEAEKSGIDRINKINPLDWAKSQIGYILGDSGQSYVIGYGKKFPKFPYHKGSSCPKKLKKSCGWTFLHSKKRNPNKLIGALVGGPNANDEYSDKRDQQNNRVSLDANVGLQMALAGLS